MARPTARKRRSCGHPARLPRSEWLVPEYLRNGNLPIWICGHDIDGLVPFAGVESDTRLADRCAYCLGPANENGVGPLTVGVTCPEPEGIGPFQYGQIMLVEVGGRILHGEFVVFEDEPELQVPGEWSVHLRVCGAVCNLLIRALARADVVRAFRTPPDSETLYVPLFDPNYAVDDREWTLRDRALARIDEWIAALLRERLGRCGWCDAEMALVGHVLAAAVVEGNDIPRRRPSITAVRLVDRLVPGLPIAYTHGPSVCVVFCSDECRHAARQAVEGAARQIRH